MYCRLQNMPCKLEVGQTSMGGKLYSWKCQKHLIRQGADSCAGLWGEGINGEAKLFNLKLCLLVSGPENLGSMSLMKAKGLKGWSVGGEVTWCACDHTCWSLASVTLQNQQDFVRGSFLPLPASPKLAVGRRLDWSSATVFERGASPQADLVRSQVLLVEVCSGIRTRMYIMIEFSKTEVEIRNISLILEKKPTFPRVSCRSPHMERNVERFISV